jgi:hypothetical protein
LMHALVRFANVAASNRFRTCDVHAPATAALGCTLSRRFQRRQSFAIYRSKKSRLTDLRHRKNVSFS